MNPDPLAALRPLHLPDPVGWWPPAPLWWLLAALVLAASCWGAFALWRRHRRNRYRRTALDELRAAVAEHTLNGDSQGFAARAGTILRRAALARYPREDVAPLCDTAWLAFLDRSAGMQAFANGAGRALLRAPYDPDAEFDAAELARACGDWLRRHR